MITTQNIYRTAKRTVVCVYKGRKEILACVVTWTDLEDIVLTEKSLWQKHKHRMIPLR